MAGEIGELVGEDFEDRGVDLNCAYVLGAENEPGKNVTTAAHANNRDVGRGLHQVGGIDDVVLQVGELADVTIVPGDDRVRTRVDIEDVLIYLYLRRVGKTPAERLRLAERHDPHARVSIPALEQRSDLLSSLGPEHAQMAFAGNIKSGVHDRCGGQGQRDGAAQTQAADVSAIPHHDPARGSGKGSDPQCCTHRIDDEQYEDNPEASERRSCKVGRIEPTAAIGQARQQKRYADATFGKRPYE